MKKFFVPFILLGAIIIQACEGPIGREGPMGPEGPPGVSVEADIFEIEATFAAATDWSVIGEYDDFGGLFLSSDKLLIYHLWEQGDADVWRMLPQTIFMQQGIFQYNYDFTDLDFQIFLEGNFDLNTLEPVWTDNQIFRLVILPTVPTNFRIDYSNYEEVVKHFNLDEDNIKRVTLK
ncbi:MAG TPA: hypothetical protein VK921_15350 [Anditalea sp.]|nr:hypothetical protein [Anditalea sp.]